MSNNTKFKVGQVWRARDGSSHTIAAISEHDIAFPVSSNNYSWTTEGNSGLVDVSLPLDLVELIADAPEPVKPAPRFDTHGLHNQLLVAAVQGFCSGFAASNDIWPDSRDPSHYEVVAEHALKIVDAVIAEIEKRGGEA
jgi:hypothetical protein